MRRGAEALIVVLAALTQVTWAPRLQIAGVFPNLVLLVVIAITWRRGVRAGFAAACGGGVLLDLTSAGAVGPHVIALLAGVYATGFWLRNVESPNPLHAAASAGAATILYSLVLVLAALAMRDSNAGLAVDAELALAAALCNALLAPFAVAVMRALDSLARAPEAR